ncbi:hypothetical protein GCM10008090_05860 [Arenicella chitinivorans]|uniref:Uncharacterized protein n=1 Tax=Arenicella chitinivorans TaxID=1329800 RepID=A0A918VHU6_9GAMM|nr:hypothetical protein GCM10008090_05860 [Arenicella chitinivorans]
MAVVMVTLRIWDITGVFLVFEVRVHLSVLTLATISLGVERLYMSGDIVVVGGQTLTLILVARVSQVVGTFFNIW